MSILKRVGLFLLPVALYSCATVDQIRYQTDLEPILADKVKVFLGSRIPCETNVVSLIRIDGEFLSRERLILTFKQKAAENGATMVQVTYMRQDYPEGYRGSARALVCKQGGNLKA